MLLLLLELSFLKGFVSLSVRLSVYPRTADCYAMPCLAFNDPDTLLFLRYLLIRYYRIANIKCFNINLLSSSKSTLNRHRLRLDINIDIRIHIRILTSTMETQTIAIALSSSRLVRHWKDYFVGCMCVFLLLLLEVQTLQTVSVQPSYGVYILGNCPKVYNIKSTTFK